MRKTYKEVLAKRIDFVRVKKNGNWYAIPTQCPNMDLYFNNMNFRKR
jgi:hypothetical protein